MDMMFRSSAKHPKMILHQRAMTLPENQEKFGGLNLSLANEIVVMYFDDEK